MTDERHPADHETADELLPWYVNDTLAADEREAVRRHLAECAACRENVALLTTLDAALDRTAATPIMPQPQPERLLARIDESDMPLWRRLLAGGRSYRGAWIAVAASIAAAVPAGSWLWSHSEPAVAPPAAYETATSAPVASMMDYVLELSFEPQADADERARLLREIGASDVRQKAGGGYRLTVSMAIASLDELESFRESLESSPQVDTVSIVALQLPVHKQE